MGLHVARASLTSRLNLCKAYVRYSRRKKADSAHRIGDRIQPLLEMVLEADRVTPNLLFIVSPEAVPGQYLQSLPRASERSKTYVLPNVSKEAQLLADEVDVRLQPGEFGLDVRQGLLHRVDFGQVALRLLQVQLGLEAAFEEDDERGRRGDDSE